MGQDLDQETMGGDVGVMSPQDAARDEANAPDKYELARLRRVEKTLKKAHEKAKDEENRKLARDAQELVAAIPDDEATTSAKQATSKRPTTLAEMLTALDEEIVRLGSALAEKQAEIVRTQVKRDASKKGSEEYEAAKSALLSATEAKKRIAENLKAAQKAFKETSKALAEKQVEKGKQVVDALLNAETAWDDGIFLISGEKTWADVEKRWDNPAEQVRSCKVLKRRPEKYTVHNYRERDQWVTASSRDEWVAFVRACAAKKGPCWQVLKNVKGQQVPDLGRTENTMAILDWCRIETYHSEMRHDAAYRRDGVSLDLDPVIAEVRQAARTFGDGMVLTKEVLCEHLRLIADQDRRHEMRDWVMTAPEYVPSGTEPTPIERHFQQFVLKAGTDIDLCRRMHNIWCLQVGAALTRPRGQYRGVLVLAGNEAINKSRCIQALGPTDCIQTGQSFDPGDDDAVHRACEHAIAEMSEIDSTFRRADGSKIKAFLGREEDQFHLRYDRGQTRWGRRTVFAASVNPDTESGGKFLSGTIGDTRWWVLPVEKINLDPALDMRTVWRQAMAEVEARLAAGLPGWWAEPDLLARIAKANSAYRHTDPIYDAIEELFTVDEDARTDIAEVRAAVKAHLDLSGWTKKDANALTAALRRFSGEPKKAQGERRWQVRSRKPTDALTIIDGGLAADVLDA